MLVKEGFPPGVQQALDIVRVVGNNAVHPGEVDLDDIPETANRLFAMINYITEQMITQPRELAKLYADLPEGVRQGIARRDGRERNEG